MSLVKQAVGKRDGRMSLRVPQALIAKIAKAAPRESERRGVRLSLNDWVLVAIHEKLAADDGDAKGG